MAVVETKEKEAVRRLKAALKLKEQIEELVEKLNEHKQWFAENYPEGFKYRGVGQVIVRWMPDIVVDIDGLLRYLRSNPQALESALRLANPRHSVVARLKEMGFITEEQFGKLVTKVGEHPSVEFRR